MSKIGLSIVVDDDHLPQTAAIARVLGDRGLHVDRVVPEAGAIFATGEASDIAWARGVEGVLEVEPERGVRLPPMGGRIPQ